MELQGVWYACAFMLCIDHCMAGIGNDTKDGGAIGKEASRACNWPGKFLCFEYTNTDLGQLAKERAILYIEVHEKWIRSAPSLPDAFEAIVQGGSYANTQSAFFL